MREGFNPPKAHIHIVSNYGGLGDNLARIPAIKYVVEENPHISVTVHWHKYFLELAEFLLPPHDRLTHESFSGVGNLKDYPAPAYDFSPERLNSLGLHLTEHAFLILTDRLAPRREALSYPKAPKLPMLSNLPKYPVAFTVAHTAPVRKWPAYSINQLAEHLVREGYQPILLGNTSQDGIKGELDNGINKTLFKDFTNKTSLLECFAIMQRCEAIIGVDNGLLHLAHYTNRPVVVGYTSVLARDRVPVRKDGITKVIEATVPCHGCQSKGTFINHDYKFCLFKDYACTLEMRAERFKQALKEIGLDV